MWLGSFVARETGLTEDPERYRRFHVWDGECHVHAGIRPDDIVRTRAEHPGAEFLIHPECGCSTQAMEYVASGDVDAEGVHMLSTSGMLKHVEAHPEGEFIVATETGMLYPLQQAAPQARLIEANRMAFCKYMKMITLPKVRDSLRDLEVEVKVAADDRRARPGADRAHGRDRLAPRRDQTSARVAAGSVATCSRWRRDWSSVGFWPGRASRSSPAPRRAAPRWRPSESRASRAGRRLGAC